MIDYQSLALLLTGFIALGCFSILYKDNAFFKFTENMYVGLGIGSTVIIGIERGWSLAVKKILQGEIILVVPMILGFVTYLTMSRKYNWIGRIPLAAMTGLGLAFSARGLLSVNLVEQVKGAMVNLINWENLLSLVGATAALTYFFYSRELKGVLGGYAKIGRWFLMLAFGAFLSNSLLLYATSIIGVVENILLPPAWYLIPIGIAVVAIDVVVSRMGILWRSVKEVEVKPSS